MTPTELRAEHEKQIAWLLAGETDLLLAYFTNSDEERGIWRSACEREGLCYTIWGLTGSDDRSVFAALPGSIICLAQAKSSLFTSERRKIRDIIDLEALDRDPNVPSYPTAPRNFTEAELRRMSELQIQARIAAGALAKEP